MAVNLRSAGNIRQRYSPGSKRPLIHCPYNYGMPGRMPVLRWLTEGFSDKTNPENRHLGFVQKLHLPFGVLFQAARKTAEEVAADLGHLGPGGLAAFEFGSLIGRACIVAVADPKKIQRHD